MQIKVDQPHGVQMHYTIFVASTKCVWATYGASSIHSKHGRICFPWIKRPVRGTDSPPTYSAEFNDRQLYLYPMVCSRVNCLPSAMSQQACVQRQHSIYCNTVSALHHNRPVSSSNTVATVTVSALHHNRTVSSGNTVSTVTQCQHCITTGLCPAATQ